MAEVLSLPNFLDANILEKLQLSADAAAGQAVISPLNVDSLSDGDYLCLIPGMQTSEIRQIETDGVSTDPQQITFTANLLVQHRNHEDVVKLYGNQIQVWRAPNVDGTIPLDGAFSYLATVTIDPTQQFTYYTDDINGSDYWYKFAYYNPTTEMLTDISLAEAVRGGGWGDYVSIEEIKEEAGLDRTRNLNVSEIAARRAAAQSKIKGALASAGYVMPLQTQNGVYFVPDIIRDIARVYAAGLVLKRNFGTTNPSSAKDGDKKMQDAKDDIAEIQLRDTMLLDSNEQVLALVNLVSGYPDNNSRPPEARMDKIF